MSLKSSTPTVGISVAFASDHWGYLSCFGLMVLSLGSNEVMFTDSKYSW